MMNKLRLRFRKDKRALTGSPPRRISAVILWCALVFLCCAALCANDMSPIRSDIQGTTINSMIARGNLVYHITSPGLSCDHAPVTAFGNILKTPSQISEKYNVVVPVGGSIAGVYADFIDKDFFVSDQGEYTVWEQNDSTYSVTSSGYPVPVNLSGVTSVNVGSFGIFGNFTGVPVGKYPSTFTITDEGSLTHNNVTDSPGTFDFDLWVIDLAEKTGTISVDQGDVYEIDLTAVPGDFPHENACEISVSWGGMLPFFNVPSGLYRDAACQEQITADAGTICRKTWAYGASGTPEKIYYKRPEWYVLQDTYYIRLNVNNTTLIQSELNFTYMSTAFLARADAPAPAIIKGYWTHSLVDYPSCEWKDDDGTNSDVIGYTGSDKDRPFVFSQGSNFRLDTADFKPYSGGSLSGSWSVSSNKHSFSSSGTLPSADNEGKYHVSFSEVNGSALDVINSEMVTLNWSAAGESFRTKHKVYTIGGTLNANNKFHTLIDIGCEAAKGLLPSNENTVFNSIWDMFATKSLYRIDDKDSALSSNRLKYWGPLTQDSELTHNTLPQLIKDRDGDCYAWTQMFLETLKIQGVEDHLNGVRLKEVEIAVDNDELVYYNGYPFKVEYFLQQETEVQGYSIDLPYFIQHDHVFDRHSLVQYGNDIYDVGTGLKYSPANGLTAVQNYVKTALKVFIIDALTQTQGYIVNSQLVTNIENAIREVE